MALDAKTLAAGDGWYVQDVICTAGPRDRPFEEQHQAVSLAAVLSGTFQYRTAQGAALLAPGAVMLGNHGCCFECGHEHGAGDRCLAFHFTPGYWEDVASGVPGVRRTAFAAPSVPPAPSMAPVIAAAEAARRAGGPALEEIALEFAAVVLRTHATLRTRPRSPCTRDERRVSDALRRIEEAAHDSENEMLSIGRLAREADMSPYHFLRTFRALVGMTPHQYVLRTRMNRAAVDLRLSDKPIAAVAYEAGFNDLSTFNRRFRRLMGATPGAYRRDAQRR